MGNSIIDIIENLELGKSAAIFVEKTCNAIGILYEPTRIRRKAKAETDAEIMKAEALSEIEERGFLK